MVLKCRQPVAHKNLHFWCSRRGILCRSPGPSTRGDRQLPGGSPVSLEPEFCWVHAHYFNGGLLFENSYHGERLTGHMSKI